MNADFEDWGAFGTPLFDDPEARALKRVGVVDVGSNSVRMVVFDGAARSPAYFFNEKIMCALGEGLGETGRLNPGGRVRALAAIRRFQLLARGMRIPRLTAVATAAVRDAEDGPAFRAEVERETGLVMHVIDGPEEARLSAQGVLLGWPGAHGMICDIGGASMELAEIGNGTVGKRVTSDLGPLKLGTLGGGRKAIRRHIKEVMENLREQMPFEGQRLFLVGGSWRAIARLDMVRREYPLTVLHEYRMTPKSVFETVKWMGMHEPAELRGMSGLSQARLSLLPMAGEVLRRLIRTFRPRDIAVSSYGLREGLLYEQMPERLRQRDPLIEACRFEEQKEARIPGFARELHRFIRPLFRSANDDRQRLIRAACLLHDVAWRAHPDYRHEVCFDLATRANFGGIRHRERVYLGLALLHRYKNSRAGTRFEPLIRLLDERHLREAEILGKAMRFGAMFSVEAPAEMAELGYYPKKKILELRLTPAGQDMFGEVAEARFASLARSLEAETRIIDKQGRR